MAQALREQLAVVATFPPRVITSAGQTVYSDVVDMRLHNRALVVAQGRAASTRSVKGLTVKIWNCDASGTLASTALKVGSTIPIPKTAGSEPICVIEVTADEVRYSGYGTSFNTPYRYFRASITNSTNVKDSYSLVVLADQSRYGDAEDFDNARVAEVKG